MAKGKWPGRAVHKDARGVAFAEEEQAFENAKRELLYESQVLDREQLIQAELDELNKRYQHMPKEVKRRKVSQGRADLGAPRRRHRWG